MRNWNTIFDNCPDGSEVMSNGITWTYVSDASQKSNYASQGFEVMAAPANAPAGVDNAKGPLVSSDLSVKAAVEMIVENDVQFLEGFISPTEKRKGVLNAAQAKRDEPIETVD